MTIIDDETGAQRRERRIRSDSRTRQDTTVVGYSDTSGNAIEWTGDEESSYVKIIDQPLSITGAVTIGGQPITVTGVGGGFPITVPVLAWDISQALETTGTSLAAPGVIHQIVATNSGAAIRYLQIHNLAAAPAPGAIPDFTPIIVPAGGTSSYDWGLQGLTLAVGITWAFSTTHNTYTAPGANEAWVSVGYI